MSSLGLQQGLGASASTLVLVIISLRFKGYVIGLYLGVRIGLCFWTKLLFQD